MFRVGPRAWKDSFQFEEQDNRRKAWWESLYNCWLAYWACTTRAFFLFLGPFKPAWHRIKSFPPCPPQHIPGGGAVIPWTYHIDVKDGSEQSIPTYDAGSGNRTRDTLVGGERSHHCVIPTPPKQKSTTQGRKEWPTERPSEWIRGRSLNSYFAFCKIVVRTVSGVEIKWYIM